MIVSIGNHTHSSQILEIIVMSNLKKIIRGEAEYKLSKLHIPKLDENECDYLLVI